MSTDSHPDDNLIHELVLSLYQAVEHPHLWSTWVADNAHHVEKHPALARHVRQAERLQRSISGSRSDRQTTQSILDRIPIPVVLVDRDGLPLTSNVSASRLAQATAPVTVSRLGIDIGSADLNRQLLAAIRTVTGGGNGKAPVKEVALSMMRPHQSPLHLLILGVGAHDSPIAGADAVACLFLSDPSCELPSDTDRLKKLFHFTPSEARVAAGLANGCAVTQLAEKLGLSRNTVRWHVKHVLQKAGVTSQTQFVCLIHRSPAGLL